MRLIAMRIMGLALLSSLGACCIEPCGARYFSDGPYYASCSDYSVGGTCDWGYGRGYSAHVYRAPGYRHYGPGLACPPGTRPKPTSTHGGGHGGNGGGHPQGSHPQGSHSGGSHGGHH